MAWLILIVAGLFEMGWGLGLKLAQVNAAWRTWGLVLAAASLGISMFLLYQAQRQIPIGTAYAIWTGIGAVGTFLIGVLIFRDPAGWLRITCISLIVAGVVGLRVAE
jgi:quaternary ammonium compound-resistance protein SugE